jgi:preprotein translocase subunit SecE
VTLRRTAIVLVLTIAAYLYIWIVLYGGHLHLRQ